MSYSGEPFRVPVLLYITSCCSWLGQMVGVPVVHMVLCICLLAALCHGQACSWATTQVGSPVHFWSWIGPNSWWLAQAAALAAQ